MDDVSIVVCVVVVIVVVIVLAFTIRSYYQNRNEADSNPTLREIRRRFKKISPEFENIPLRSGNSAYTENKSIITLCLKDPHTDHVYDINTLMYVALHELAHYISSSTGHGNEFTHNFDILLRKAKELGVS